MILALGTPLPANVKPWKYFDVDAVMVSAYYILKSASVKRRVYEKGLKDYLDFDGLVILDSGVFQLMNSHKEVELERISELYSHIEGADVKLSFDWPDDRITQNYKQMTKFCVEPVIPYTKLDLLEYFEDENCEWIFIGRLAKMLMKRGRHGFGRMTTALSRIRSLSSKKLWSLGVGNSKTLPILINTSFDGSDTSSYRVAAAYGDIIVPEKGTQHISGRKSGKKNWGMRIAEEEEIKLFLEKLGFTYDDLKTSFEKRTVFNAYTLTHNTFFS